MLVWRNQYWPDCYTVFKIAAPVFNFSTHIKTIFKSKGYFSKSQNNVCYHFTSNF